MLKITLLLVTCVSFCLKDFDRDFNDSFGSVLYMFDKLNSFPKLEMDLNKLEPIGSGYFSKVYRYSENVTLKVSAFMPELFQVNSLSNRQIKAILQRMESFPEDKSEWIERYREPFNIGLVKEALPKDKLSHLTLPHQIYFNPRKLELYFFIETNKSTLFEYISKLPNRLKTAKSRENNNSTLISMIYSIVETVSFVNEAGFVCYDVNQKNFMLSRDGFLKMIDVGKLLPSHSTLSKPNFYPIIRLLNMGPEKYVNNLNARSIGVDSWQLAMFILEVCTLENKWIHVYKRYFSVNTNFIELSELVLVLVFDPEFRHKLEEIYRKECVFLKKYIKTEEFSQLLEYNPEKRLTSGQLREIIKQRNGNKEFNLNNVEWN